MLICICFLALSLNLLEGQNEDILMWELQKQNEILRQEIKESQKISQEKINILEKRIHALKDQLKSFLVDFSIEDFSYRGEKKYSKDKSYTLKEYRHKKTGIDFVLIPGGSFQMGSNDGYRDEKPVHPVKVEWFLMSKYEVTQEQWKSIMKKNPSHFKGTKKPVEQVSWKEAKDFCLETGLRLPSEAEWEYACRAGTSSKYYWGDGADGEYMIYNDNSSKSTADVGSKKPNAFGLYDMSGNVWEWCEDVWHHDYSKAPEDGTPWTSKGSSIRVLRGGSWANKDRFCRSANRDKSRSHYCVNSLGFRVARSFFP